MSLSMSWKGVWERRMWRVGWCVLNVAWMKELVGVCNGSRLGIAETTPAQAVDIESDLLTT